MKTNDRWKRVSLFQILETLENGSRPKGGIKKIEEGIPSIGGEHLSADGRFDFENLRLVSKEFYSSLKRGKIKPQDVLVVKDGATTGKTSFVGNDFPYEESAVNEHVFILRGRKEIIEQKFLFYHLRSPIGQKQVDANFHGAAIGGINTQFAKNYFLSLPPIDVQRRLVSILEKAEQLQQWRKESDKLTNDYLNSVFLKMFGDPLKNDKGWEMDRLENVATIERGRFSPRPRNDPAYYNGEYPFIQTGDISSSHGLLYRWSQTLNYKGRKISKSFSTGTIVIAIVGATIGETAILCQEVYAPDSVVGIKVNPEKANNFYIEYVLRFWKQLFRAIAPHTARANINLKIIKPIKIPLPPINLQNKFGEISKYYFTVRDCELNSEQQINNLFNILMDRAFSGELLC